VANYVLAMGGVEISRVCVQWQLPAWSDGPSSGHRAVRSASIASSRAIRSLVARMSLSAGTMRADIARSAMVPSTARSAVAQSRRAMNAASAAVTQSEQISPLRR
jgi:hypothetical protein